MPVENTIEKARMAMESGNMLRAKEILRSSFGNYGFSPPLLRAYADVLIALNQPTQAGLYLFFSVEELDEKSQEAVCAFLSDHSADGYKSIVRALRVVRVARLSELPAYSQQKLRDLGAPEDLSRLYSSDGGWTFSVPCVLTAAIIFVLLACIGLWTVFLWIIR
jgi:hypothetical protein